MNRTLELKFLDSPHWRIVLILFLAVVTEGIDLQIIGIAAPAILQEWHLSRSRLGPVMAGALFGMVIGAPLGGRLADRVGRRPLVIGGLCIIGILTALIAAAGTLTQIAILRVVAGIGFGAVLTAAPALAAEWMPQGLRHQVAASVVVGTPVGGMIGAALGSWIVPALGWRDAFLIAGGPPIVLAIAIALWVPESDEFLRAHLYEYGDLEHKPRRNFADMFAPLYRHSTVGLALAFFANLAVSYAFFNWTPTLLTSIGMPMRAAILGLFYFNLLGILGAMAASWLIPRFGTRLLLFALAIFGATLSVVVVAPLVLSLSTDSTGGSYGLLGLPIGIALIGVANVAGQATLVALAAHVYATECRATGLGTVGSAGRAGGLVSAFCGGLVLALPFGGSVFMCLVGALFALTFAGVAIVDRHVARR